MMSRRSLLAGFASLISMAKAGAQSILSLNPSFAAPSGIPPFSSIVSAPLIGAGGWVTGLQFANDGAAYARTDTSPCVWYLAPGATQFIPRSFLPLYYNDGLYEVACCPINSSYICAFVSIYAGGSSSMYYSSDAGVTLTAATGFPTYGTKVNSGTTTYYGCARMACDPFNAANWVAVHPTSGAYQSTDFGETWAHIAAITTPSGTANGIVVFDPGNANIVYVFSSGTGWYKSTTGVNGTFTLTSGTPTNSTSGACDISNGTLYAGSGSTTVYTYKSGVWASATCGVSAWSVAADPGNTGRAIALAQTYGTISVTTNSGSSWSTGSTNTHATCASGTNSISWIVWVTSQLMTAPAQNIDSSRAAFNPATSNDLYATNGIGILRCNPSNTPATIGDYPAWYDFSAGIENMVVNKIICSSGSGPLYCCWDRSTLLVLNPDNFPAFYAPYDSAAAGNLSQCWSASAAPSASNVIAAICNYGQSLSGLSQDGGRTWTTFASATPQNGANCPGGSIACATSSKITWVGAGSSPASEMWNTTNGGTSWALSTGAPASGWNGSEFYYPNQLLVQDKVDPNYQYAYNGGHIYQSSNSGSSFSSVSTPGFTGPGSLQAWLDTAINNTGHLFFTQGWSSTSSSGAPFYFSSDRGFTWNSVSGIATVWSFGFGASYPGKTYPTIFAFGQVSGIFGIYRCIDFNPAIHSGTFVLVQSFVAGIRDCITAVQGDPDVFGVIYLGYQGSGSRLIVCNDAAPWVKPSVPAPGATVTRASPPSWTALAASEIAYSSVSWAISDGTNTATGTGLTPTIALGGLNAGPGTVAVTTVGNGQTAVVTIPVTLA